MSEPLDYGFKTVVAGSVQEVEAQVRSALQAEGFGVLTEIDIAGAFKAKLDVDFKPYKILGACSPPLAHRAITEEEDIGLLLPCNVVVYEGEEPGTAVVAALDPVQQLGIAGREDMGDLATEVQARLKRVIEGL